MKFLREKTIMYGEKNQQSSFYFSDFLSGWMTIKFHDAKAIAYVRAIRDVKCDIHTCTMGSKSMRNKITMHENGNG